MKFVRRLCQQRAEELEKTGKPENAVKWYLWAKNTPMAERCAATIKSPKKWTEEPKRAQAYARIGRSHKKPETKIDMLIRAYDEAFSQFNIDTNYARDYIGSACKVALKHWKSLPKPVLDDLIAKAEHFERICPQSDTYPERLNDIIETLDFRIRNSYY